MPDRYQKRTSSKTGQDVWTDEFGDPITDAEEILKMKQWLKAQGKEELPYEYKDDSLLRLKPGSEAGIKAPTAGDYFFNYGGKYFQPAMTAAGGIVGLGLGGPLGSAVGAGTGSMIGRLGQVLAPEYLGEYNPSGAGDVIRDTAIDSAVDLFGTGVGTAAKYLAPSFFKPALQNIFKKQFPSTASQEMLDALAADPKFKFSVGQVSEGARALEHEFAPAETKQFIQNQEKIIRDQAEKLRINPEDAIEIAQQNAQANVAQMKSQVKLDYEKFEPNIARNTRIVRVQTGTKQSIDPVTKQIVKTPIYKDIPLEGAIPVNQSGKFADLVGEQIDKVLTPDPANIHQIGSGTGYPLSKLKTELDKLRAIRPPMDPNTGQFLPQPLAEINQMKAMRDEIGNFLGSDADKTIKSRLKGTLEGLRKTLNNDIEEGVKGWGPKAYKDYRRAQETYKNFALKVDNKTAQQLLNSGMGEEATYTQVARSALRDPQRMREFVNVTKDRATASKLFVSDMIDKAWDKAGNRFDPNIALQHLERNKGVAKEAVSSQTRTNIERFLRKAQVVEPFGASSNTALRWKVKGGIALAAGLGTMLTGSGLPTSAAVAGTTMMLAPTATKNLVERLLLNPKMARIAANLQTVNPISKTAQIGARTLMTLIKGEQVILRSPDGREFPATINNEGKPIVDQSRPSPIDENMPK